MILPEYLSLLITDAESANISERNLLKEIKLLKEISHSGPCRRTMAQLQLSPNSLIPWERMAQSTCERLRKYGISQVERKT